MRHERPNDAVRRRLVGDETDLEPDLARDLRRLRADADEHRAASGATRGREAAARRAAREHDRVRDPEREDPPHRRLDEHRAVGDDDVHLGPPAAQLVGEPRLGDVGLRHEHALACELAEAGGDVLRRARGDERRLDSALANRVRGDRADGRDLRARRALTRPSLTAATPFTLVRTIQS